MWCTTTNVIPCRDVVGCLAVVDVGDSERPRLDANECRLIVGAVQASVVQRVRNPLRTLDANWTDLLLLLVPSKQVNQH